VIFFVRDRRPARTVLRDGLVAELETVEEFRPRLR